MADTLRERAERRERARPLLNPTLEIDDSHSPEYVALILRERSERSSGNPFYLREPTPQQRKTIEAALEKKREREEYYRSLWDRERRETCCHYCNVAFGARGSDLRRQGTWDHIVPQEFCGRNDLWNLVRACRSCNSSKGAAIPYHDGCEICATAIERHEFSERQMKSLATWRLDSLPTRV